MATVALAAIANSLPGITRESVAFSSDVELQPKMAEDILRALRFRTIESTSALMNHPTYGRPMQRIVNEFGARYASSELLEQLRARYCPRPKDFVTAAPLIDVVGAIFFRYGCSLPPPN